MSDNTNKLDIKIFERILTEGKKYTLFSPLKNDLALSLFNLKQRGIILSHTKIRKKDVKVGQIYSSTVKVNQKKSTFKRIVKDFYGDFVKVK